MLRIHNPLLIVLSLLLITAHSCFADKDQASFDSDFDFEGDFESEFDMDDEEVFDPLIGLNRVMFKFNDKLYFLVLVPVGSTYSIVLPEKARISINSVFLNLEFPIRFINNVLQLKFKNAGIELVRFSVNTTWGIAGLMDPAYTKLKLTSRDEDFGQTLGRYGVGEGFPLVLPFYGVSNLRDSIGKIPDSFLSPIYFIRNIYVKISVITFEKVNYASLHLGEYEMIKKEALDPYTFMRDAYSQIRKKRIEE